MHESGKWNIKLEKLRGVSQIMEDFIYHAREFRPYSTVSRELEINIIKNLLCKD